MSLIRGTGNKNTELRLIQVFRRNEIVGWRRKSKVFGKPDFVFREHKIAIFVDGCFWHGCPQHGVRPQQNAEFWLKKFLGNRTRDRRVTRTLRKQGWIVVRIWEHELTRKNESLLLKRLRSTLPSILFRKV
jgi:DNA mismatch endonuclease (patch repair protein)